MDEGTGASQDVSVPHRRRTIGWFVGVTLLEGAFVAVLLGVLLTTLSVFHLLRLPWAIPTGQGRPGATVTSASTLGQPVTSISAAADVMAYLQATLNARVLPTSSSLVWRRSQDESIVTWTSPGSSQSGIARVIYRNGLGGAIDLRRVALTFPTTLSVQPNTPAIATAMATMVSLPHTAFGPWACIQQRCWSLVTTAWGKRSVSVAVDSTTRAVHFQECEVPRDAPMYARFTICP